MPVTKRSNRIFIKVKHETKWKRALAALPFLGLSAAALYVLNVNRALPWAEAMVAQGNVAVGSGSVPLRKSFTGIQVVDHMLAVINTFFFPAIYGTSQISRFQLQSFLADGGVLLIVWMTESCRRDDGSSIIHPIAFLLAAQIVGIGVVAPLYYFAHYVCSPLEDVATLTHDAARRKAWLAAVPAILLCYHVPLYGMFYWVDLAGRQLFLFAFEIYPLTMALILSVTHALLPQGPLSENRYQPDKKSITLIVHFILSSVNAIFFWGRAYLYTPGGLRGTFLPDMLPGNTQDLASFAVQWLKWDYIFTHVSGFLWVVYLTWDIYKAGLVSPSSWDTAKSVAATLGGGPGCTFAMNWIVIDFERVKAMRKISWPGAALGEDEKSK